jgi:SNF2 family DNA or RNA helicase
MLQRTDLRTYQKRAVDFMKRKPHAGLFLDMGLGKTVSTLTALRDLLAHGTVERVLLVAPLRPVEAGGPQVAAPAAPHVQDAHG